MVIPALAVFRWTRMKNPPSLPTKRIVLSFLIVLLLIFYGQFGPFYKVDVPTTAKDAEEFFKLLSVVQKPIVITIYGLFIAQLVYLIYMPFTIRRGTALVVVTFTLASLFLTFCAFLFAMASLLGT